jgi:hypothetical protein
MKEKGKWDDVEVKVFCDNALDQWALWLDQIDIDSPKSFGLDHVEYLKARVLFSCFGHIFSTKNVRKISYC